jgi:poly(A) polymerase
VKALVERLRYSSREIDHIAALVREQPRFRDVEMMSTPALKRFLRTDWFSDHLELYRIRVVAAHAGLDTLDFVRDRLEGWGTADLFPEPLLSGDDLIKLGFRPGPSFRRILDAVEDEQLEGRLTTHEDAVVFVRGHFV